jgi:hypothetical protein
MRMALQATEVAVSTSVSRTVRAECGGDRAVALARGAEDELGPEAMARLSRALSRNDDPIVGSRSFSARDLDVALSRLSTRRLQALLSLDRHSRGALEPFSTPN